MNFDEMVDQPFEFYGIDNNQFRLGKLDTGELVTFEAMEDENDGYRSYLGSIEVIDSSESIFFQTPVALVRIAKSEKADTFFEGYYLVDVADDHVWLTFGTDNNDDYYPYFTFRYEPKAPT